MNRRPPTRCSPPLACLLLALLAAPLLAAQTPPRRPNLIFISIDTLRADRVGCYSSTVSTPAMEQLCREGIVFERAIVQAPLTLPSHAAMLTGTYPFHNGVQDFTGRALPQRFRTVAEALRAGGYVTGAVVSAFVLDRSWGLARGFDHYDDGFSAASFTSENLGLVERRGGESVDRALAWLQAAQQKPFFLWLHLFDPHSPYDPPEPFRSRYQDRPYDGEVAYVDAQLARLIGWLKANRLYDATELVLVSDHGESLGEHGEKEHGFFLYDSTIHVPLIIKPAAARKLGKPRRIPHPVETIALAPHLLQAAGITDDAIWKQFQSAPLLDARPENAAYSETFYPFSSFGWSPLRSLQTGRYHYVQAPRPELYDLRRDPGQESNIATRQTAMREVLQQRLTELLRRHAPPEDDGGGPGVDAETAEKLRALGYVAARSPVPPARLHQPLRDPKDKLWEFNAILDATDALQQGDAQRGMALLSQVQKREPELYLIPFLLGQAATRRQEWAQAVIHFRRTLELNASFDEAMTGYARALHMTGEGKQARSWLEKAIASNPQNFRAWYLQSWIEARDGHHAAAQRALEETLAIQPNFAPARRDLGMLMMSQQRFAAAAEHLARAVELGIADARLLNFLGIAYSRTERLAEAVAAYRQAIAQQPGLAEARLNLAYAYQRMQRLDEARAEYEAACRLESSFCRYVPQP